MKTFITLVATTGFLCLALGQQAPDHKRAGAANQIPGEPTLELRVKKLEDLTRAQTDVIKQLAEEVKLLRKDVDQLKVHTHGN